MFVRLLLIGAGAAFLSNAATVSSQITFNKDVLPVMQKRCQACHRPGEVAPMSFLTYKDVRPWAKAIREAVLTRKMPPWFADPHYGKFANDRSLNKDEIATIISWWTQVRAKATRRTLHRQSNGWMAGVLASLTWFLRCRTISMCPPPAQLNTSTS